MSKKRLSLSLRTLQEFYKFGARTRDEDLSMTPLKHSVQALFRATSMN